MSKTDTRNACADRQRQNACVKLTFSLCLCCIRGNQKRKVWQSTCPSMLNHICREPGPTAAPALAGQRDEKKARHGQTRCVFPISKTPNGALYACLLCLIHCGSLAFPSFIIFDFRFLLLFLLEFRFRALLGSGRTIWGFAPALKPSYSV